jgi:hypothetical protein
VNTMAAVAVEAVEAVMMIKGKIERKTRNTRSIGARMTVPVVVLVLKVMRAR